MPCPAKAVLRHRLMTQIFDTSSAHPRRLHAAPSIAAPVPAPTSPPGNTSVRPDRDGSPRRCPAHNAAPIGTAHPDCRVQQPSTTTIRPLSHRRYVSRAIGQQLTARGIAIRRRGFKRTQTGRDQLPLMLNLAVHPQPMPRFAISQTRGCCPPLAGRRAVLWRAQPGLIPIANLKRGSSAHFCISGEFRQARRLLHPLHRLGVLRARGECLCQLILRFTVSAVR